MMALLKKLIRKVFRGKDRKRRAGRVSSPSPPPRPAISKPSPGSKSNRQARVFHPADEEGVQAREANRVGFVLDSIYYKGGCGPEGLYGCGGVFVPPTMDEEDKIALGAAATTSQSTLGNDTDSDSDSEKETNVSPTATLHDSTILSPRPFSYHDKITSERLNTMEPSAHRHPLSAATYRTDSIPPRTSTPLIHPAFRPRAVDSSEPSISTSDTNTSPSVDSARASQYGHELGYPFMSDAEFNALPQFSDIEFDSDYD
ncbi:unnamed protein product [Periconia digitata]|uniref:Uncharacterized protein n=1 Tax=Periconia digitata TaxID=1303443 RepID=A0A9W4UC99_9PLEO|nr:unnamed protein product [Periconia digitata]